MDQSLPFSSKLKHSREIRYKNSPLHNNTYFLKYEIGAASETFAHTVFFEGDAPSFKVHRWHQWDVQKCTNFASFFFLRESLFAISCTPNDISPNLRTKLHKIIRIGWCWGWLSTGYQIHWTFRHQQQPFLKRLLR